VQPTRLKVETLSLEKKEENQHLQDSRSPIGGGTPTTCAASRILKQWGLLLIIDGKGGRSSEISVLKIPEKPT